MKNRTVSAIVPVYREEKNIAGVLNPLLDSDAISEIICVLDEPTGKCLKLLQPFKNKVRLISFKKCRGKGRALAAGIEVARGEIIAFFDSDLVGLKRQHVVSLLAPLLNGESRVAIGVPAVELNGFFGKWAPTVAGESAYYRQDLLAHLDEMLNKGYGIEVFFNSLFKKGEKKIVSLVGVVNPRKEKKWNSSLALKRYLVAGIDLAQEIGRMEIKSPIELEKLENLTRVRSFDLLVEKIAEVRNKKVRDVFEKYFYRYLNYIKKFKS